MFNFNFLLEEPANNSFTLVMFAMIAVFVIMMIMGNRKNKKEQEQIAAMRDGLTVGDEVTTIGGIIGKVVSIKEDTFVLETTRDKTHIRFHKRALHTVDVSVAAMAAEAAAEKAEAFLFLFYHFRYFSRKTLSFCNHIFILSYFLPSWRNIYYNAFGGRNEKT